MIEFDIDAVANNITPPRLRSYETMAFIEAIAEPYRAILERLYLEAAQRKYEMAFTGQVCYLRRLLNDKFDPIQRRIWIGNYSLGTKVHIFNKHEENEPVYVLNKAENAPLYLFNSFEAHYSFVIHVPIGQVTNYNEFRAWVDRYRLKSKMYLIQEF